MNNLYMAAGYFAVSFFIAFVALHFIMKFIENGKKSVRNRNAWQIALAVLIAFAFTYRAVMGM